MREKNWLTKIIVILVGSIISAYGITLAMYAGFGSATLAVLWQGVSKVTGMSIGMTSFVILFCKAGIPRHIPKLNCIIKSSKSSLYNISSVYISITK